MRWRHLQFPSLRSRFSELGGEEKAEEDQCCPMRLKTGGLSVKSPSCWHVLKESKFWLASWQYSVQSCWSSSSPSWTIWSAGSISRCSRWVGGEEVCLCRTILIESSHECVGGEGGVEQDWISTQGGKLQNNSTTLSCQYYINISPLDEMLKSCGKSW